MARTTKADLEAHVASLEAALEVARAGLRMLEAENTALAAERDLLAAKLEAAVTPSRRVMRPGYVAPEWQRERAAAMAAAKALAMATGRVVRA